MSNSKGRYLAVIPARGGSKGIPRKNLKPLAGKPLIGYTIDVALEVFPVEDICLSTDDDEIMDYGRERGLEIAFRRPAELASDTANSSDVLRHALNNHPVPKEQYNGVIMLQPTSPFRKAAHLREAIEKFERNPGVDMVVGVKETQANPYYVLFEENEEGFLRKSKEGQFERRQDCPVVWEFNGAVYVIDIAAIETQQITGMKKILPYPMDEESSLDIDTTVDLKYAEFMMKEINKTRGGVR